MSKRWWLLQLLLFLAVGTIVHVALRPFTSASGTIGLIVGIAVFVVIYRRESY